MTQEQQVIAAMREIGGFATLRRLNEAVDFSNWGTKTPEASVRRIVQKSPFIFKIRPGLWALEECRNEVLKKFELSLGDKISEENFSHSYYQGLLAEIGNILKKTTYVPSQDKRKLFLGSPLSTIATRTDLPTFGDERALKRARTVDVIWFNDRMMPDSFYEVEHTTDIKNSISKFYELQDFNASFFVVADTHRKNEFLDKLSASAFKPIQQRVKFLDYARVAAMHKDVQIVSKSEW